MLRPSPRRRLVHFAVDAIVAVVCVCVVAVVAGGVLGLGVVLLVWAVSSAS